MSSLYCAFGTHGEDLCAEPLVAFAVIKECQNIHVLPGFHDASPGCTRCCVANSCHGGLCGIQLRFVVGFQVLQIEYASVHNFGYANRDGLHLGLTGCKRSSFCKLFFSGLHVIRPDVDALLLGKLLLAVKSIRVRHKTSTKLINTSKTSFQERQSNVNFSILAHDLDLTDSGSTLVHGLDVDFDLALKHQRPGVNGSLLSIGLCLCSSTSLVGWASALRGLDTSNRKVHQDAFGGQVHTHTRSVNHVFNNGLVHTSPLSANTRSLQCRNVCPGLVGVRGEVVYATLSRLCFWVCCKHSTSSSLCLLLNTLQFIIERGALVIRTMSDELCKSSLQQETCNILLGLLREESNSTKRTGACSEANGSLRWRAFILDRNHASLAKGLLTEEFAALSSVGCIRLVTSPGAHQGGPDGRQGDSALLTLPRSACELFFGANANHDGVPAYNFTDNTFKSLVAGNCGCLVVFPESKFLVLCIFGGSPEGCSVLQRGVLHAPVYRACEAVLHQLYTDVSGGMLH
mmetsp:Transcript_13167/g.23370  ORF Transcript_13167/g.23370 Transcript_13167/m.23370 type:complete len:516 (+) Transcript_13167:598-2145(+)